MKDVNLSGGYVAACRHLRESRQVSKQAAHAAVPATNWTTCRHLTDSQSCCLPRIVFRLAALPRVCPREELAKHGAPYPAVRCRSWSSFGLAVTKLPSLRHLGRGFTLTPGLASSSTGALLKSNDRGFYPLWDDLPQAPESTAARLGKRGHTRRWPNARPRLDGSWPFGSKWRLKLIVRLQARKTLQGWAKATGSNAEAGGTAQREFKQLLQKLLGEPPGPVRRSDRIRNSRFLLQSLWFLLFNIFQGFRFIAPEKQILFGTHNSSNEENICSLK